MNTMWQQLAAAALGVWLTASPGVLDYRGAAWANAHVCGPLAATVGLVAACEVTRPLRRLNGLIGLWVAAAPWVLSYRPAETLNSTAVGLGLIALGLLRAPRAEALGGGWRALWDPAAAERARANA